MGVEGAAILESLRESANEAAGRMQVDGPSSPAAGPCEDQRAEIVDEKLENGSASMAHDTNCTSPETGNESPKVAPEKSGEAEDGHEESDTEEAKVAEAAFKEKVEAVKQKFVQETKGYGLSRLETLHASICKLLQRNHGENRTSRLASLESFLATSLL